MVDAGDKAPTVRSATACALVRMLPATFALAAENRAAKGNVLETARIAGTMAAKKTWDLIPMCHPVQLTHVRIDFSMMPGEFSIRVFATAKTKGPTGVEMEALTAASMAALTIYDMLKAVDKGITITDLRLLEKSGGKSGLYRAADADSLL
jgi:cyclic pyranopterin phosphate synthase